MPTPWNKIHLGEVVDINTKSIGKNYPFDEILYLDISSVGTGLADKPVLLKLKEAPSRAKRLVYDGDTILSTVRPNRRSFLYLKKPSENLVVSTGFAVLHPKSINPRFLYYLVTNQSFTDYLTLHAKGAAYPAVDAETISRAKVSIPSIEVQDSVADILGAYDDLIENNTRRIQILEQMAQAIYKEWFVNLHFPGHEKAKIVDSKTDFGKIPEGWEVSDLSKLVTTQYGYTESAKEEKIGPKYLRGMDINKYTFIDWDSVPYCEIQKEDLSKYKLNQGDILVIRMADPGKIGIVEDSIDAVFASYLIRLSIKNNLLSPYYLFYFLISDKYQGYIKGASSGTTRQSASAGVVIGTQIIVPEKETRELFERTVSELRIELTNLLKQNSVLRKSRDLLIPKLVSGEIRV